MKLYATTTSERATKGQGGNQYIRIELFYGSAAASTQAAVIWFKMDGDEAVLLVPGLTAGTIEHRFPIETKGKRQKGETVPERCKHGVLNSSVCMACWKGK
jgi:hypothetical protein